MQYEVRNRVEWSRLPIHDDETRASVFRHFRKSRGWVDDERRAHDDQEIALERLGVRASHRALRHRLPERDRRGLHDAAAAPTRTDAPGAAELLFDIGKLVAEAAIEADRVAYVAVQLDHLLVRYT